MYEEDHSWSFAIGLFVGALVGAAAASLFTPRSGAQNRELVREKGLVLKDRVSDAATSATSKASDVASNVNDTVKSATSSAAERASAVAATVTDTTSSTVSSVQGAASKATSTVSGTASTVATRVSGATATVAERARGIKDQVVTTASDTVGTVREKVSGAAEQGTEKGAELKERASETVTTAQEKASNAADVVANAGTQVKAQAQEAVETVQDKAGQAAGQVSETGSSVRNPVAQAMPDTNNGGSVVTTDSVGVSNEGLASSLRTDEPDIVISDTSANTGETVRLPRSDTETDTRRSGNRYSDLTTSGEGGDVPGSSGPGGV